MKKLILMMAILASLPVSADLATNDIVNDDMANENMVQGEMAQVVTHGGRPADCLAPVVVNRIDGQQKFVPAQGFKIEAGVHTLNGNAVLDTTFCKLGRGGNPGGYAPDLEIDFEAGKTYHIAYDHQSKNREEWKLVVWKIE